MISRFHGKLLARLEMNKLTLAEAITLSEGLEKLMKLCDELNCHDAFGTEGWEHAIGWDD